MVKYVLTMLAIGMSFSVIAQGYHRTNCQLGIGTVKQHNMKGSDFYGSCEMYLSSSYALNVETYGKTDYQIYKLVKNYHWNNYADLLFSLRRTDDKLGNTTKNGLELGYRIHHDGIDGSLFVFKNNGEVENKYGFGGAIKYFLSQSFSINLKYESSTSMSVGIQYSFK